MKRRMVCFLLLLVVVISLLPIAPANAKATKITTGAELAARMLDVARNYKTMYVKGAWGWPCSEENKPALINKDPGREDEIKSASEDTFAFDCVCLIKALFWGWDGDATSKRGGAEYKSNDVPDIGTETMIARCSEVSTDFADIEVGELVWMSGHVGIYVGNGLVVECTPAWNSCVQITACNQNISGYKRRNWSKHGKLPYCEYTTPCNHSSRNNCGKCTNCGNIDLSKHALSAYNNVGKCPTCSHDFDYDANMSTSAAGVYKVTVSGGINLYTKPYSAAPTTGTKIAKGAEITVEHSVKNHYGNTWYCFKYGGQKVYTSADNVAYVSTATLPQSITCTLTDPTEGQKIVKGKHPVAGTITSKNYPLQEVKAYLDGDCIATVTLGSAYSLDIRSSDINTNLAFGSLSLGNHTLVIKARDTKHSDLVTVMTRNFVITDSSGNTSTSSSCSCSTSYAGYYRCDTTSTGHNIRSGHGSSYSQVGSIPKGEVVYISKASGTGSGKWGHVTYNGVSGYTAMGYMTKMSTYTVSYNANGGSGAPSSQSKIQDVTLTLSSTKPTRSGYTFLGWATSSSATSAKYSAGGSYTSNAGVTLYAVWKSNACTHSYSSTVTKAATCSTAGTRTYTCTKCSNSYTETIAATGNHVYGSWTTTKAATCTATGTQQRKCNTCSKTESKTISATGHDYKGVTSIATCTKPEETTYTCRNCNYSYSEKMGTQTAPHKWDKGKITTSATCAKEGVKTYTCSVCKQTMTEKFAKTENHQFSDWTYTKTDHTRTCTVCGEEETGQHDYYDEWFIDESCHYSVCKICDVHRGKAHRSETDATETEPQVCIGCGYIMAPALGHTHHWEVERSYDRYKHWYACEGCSEKKDVESHAYQDMCDELCDLCGYIYTTTHYFYDGWDSDNQNHWHTCTCGKILDVAPHTWEESVCSVCGKQQPAETGKPLFIEQIIDRIITYFKEILSRESFRDFLEKAKVAKLEKELLSEHESNTLPDGEYSVVFHEEDIFTVGSIEYARIELLEETTLSNEYVRGLKVGDVIDLSDFGLGRIEVDNTRIHTDDYGRSTLCFEETSYMLCKPKGSETWCLQYWSGKAVLHVAATKTVKISPKAVVTDYCYMAGRTFENVQKLLQSYPDTTTLLDLDIVIDNGQVTAITLNFRPVL